MDKVNNKHEHSDGDDSAIRMTQRVTPEISKSKILKRTKDLSISNLKAIVSGMAQNN